MVEKADLEGNGRKSDPSAIQPPMDDDVVSTQSKERAQVLDAFGDETGGEVQCM
jgi:hypothetical protein